MRLLSHLPMAAAPTPPAAACTGSSPAQVLQALEVTLGSVPGLGQYLHLSQENFMGF